MPLTAFPACWVLLCSHSGHLLCFLSERPFRGGWEPSEKCSWFWMCLISSANLPYCCFLDQIVLRTRLPFWNVSVSQLTVVVFPSLCLRHVHVQTHFSWREDLGALQLLSPLLPALRIWRACSLFYEVSLTLAHVPSVLGSCGGAWPET